MHYFIFGAISLGFLVISYLIGIKKQLDLICTLDENNIKKIKNKDFLAKSFALYYLFIGIVSIICPFCINIYGDLGILLSVSLILILFLISIIVSILLYNYLNKI